MLRLLILIGRTAAVPAWRGKLGIAVHVCCPFIWVGRVVNIPGDRLDSLMMPIDQRVVSVRGIAVSGEDERNCRSFCGSQPLGRPSCESR